MIASRTVAERRHRALLPLPVTALLCRSPTERGEGKNRERQPLFPNGWCAPIRKEQRELLTRRRMPPFPLLRASLQGWREYYCDSDDRWLDCARYQVSLTGERVPISLLPNGALARHLEDVTEAARSGAANQPAPIHPYEQSGPGTVTPGATAHFGATSPPAPVWHHQPSPPHQMPQPSNSLGRRARQAPSSKRGWLARFADWMRGPA